MQTPLISMQQLMDKNYESHSQHWEIGFVNEFLLPQFQKRVLI